MRRILGVMLALAFALTPNLVGAIEEPQHKSVEETDCIKTIAMPTPEEASEMEAEDCLTATDEKGERFQANNILETTGMYNSSVFFAGNNVTDEAFVRGIGFIAGNNVEIKGSYEYGFHAGNVVNVEGYYERDLFVAGNSVKISGEIGRDVYAAGALVRISTDIPGDAHIGADKVIIENATIGGDMKISAGKIEFIGDVKIEGTLSHNDDATVLGDVNATAIDIYEGIKEKTSRAKFTNKILNLVWSIAAIIVFAFIGKKFFKSMDRRLEEYDTASFVKDTVIGLLSAVVAPIIMFVLFMTIAGMSVALMLFSIYMVLLCASIIIGSTIVGKYLLKVNNTILAASAVLVIVTALSFVPIVGEIVTIIVALAGFGMTTRMIFDKTPKSSSEEKKPKKSA